MFLVYLNYYLHFIEVDFIGRCCCFGSVTFYIVDKHLNSFSRINSVIHIFVTTERKSHKKCT